MSFVALTEIALRYWECLDSPIALSLAIKARAGDWEGVLRTSVNPKDYADPAAYGRANAAVCFLKKNPFIPTAVDRKAVCKQTWREGEQSCYRTNQRLATFEISPLQAGEPAEFLRRVRSRIVSWIGLGVSDDEAKRHARHGPGTTFSSAVANPTAADKFAEIPTMTRGSAIWLLNIAGTMWSEQITLRASTPGRCVEFTSGNKFAAVPKDGLRDRAIAIEPSLNVYFQLALGQVLRKRLKYSTGWDLTEAADIHREVARKASRDGSFATLDLSNASDTLSKSLVRILLGGTRWLSAMEDLRSSKTFIDGHWTLLEKFSSMGNGFTFELETIIFAAICCEVLELRGHTPEFGKNVFVFGDDLIVPTDCSTLLIRVLNWLGFSTNPSKTFVEGPFRESCGADYFDGSPVRGFYFKGNAAYGTQSIFTLHNGAKRVFNELGITNGSEFLDWLLKSCLPDRLRSLGGPSRLGDSVLLGLPARFRWRHGVKWTQAVQWSEPNIISWRFFPEAVRLACSLTGYLGTPLGIAARGSLSVTRIVWVSDS